MYKKFVKSFLQGKEELFKIVSSQEDYLCSDKFKKLYPKVLGNYVRIGSTLSLEGEEDLFVEFENEEESLDVLVEELKNFEEFRLKTETEIILRKEVSDKVKNKLLDINMSTIDAITDLEEED